MGDFASLHRLINDPFDEVVGEGVGGTWYKDAIFFQDVFEEIVEPAHLGGEGTPRMCQSAAKSHRLQTVRHNHPNFRKGLGFLQGDDALNTGFRFAGCRWGYEQFYSQIVASL
jgi:hypothetical protein